MDDEAVPGGAEFSLWTRDVQAEVLPYCVEQGIGLLPYSPLGRGFPAGRFASFDDLPEKDQRRRLPRFQQDNLQANLASRPRSARSPTGSARPPPRSPSPG
ncbi:aldo/keto reductase [Actinacidiphila yanglinensis]|uniref:aldo/keto reductase n=1 Tax=Actinacidiphila yanglinensis TaxID=310779 RepID=UPI001F2C9AEF|nr:aldo/keto reductase [Actinacidiphila yanglinensis]